MGGTIRARIRSGMIEPLEKLDVPEGSEVMITILEVPTERDLEAFRRSAGGWKGTIDAEAFIRNIRERRRPPREAGGTPPAG